MLLASRQMEPQDFQQLAEAKEADNLKFLTEEADGFYGEIRSNSKPHNKKRRSNDQNTQGRDAGVEQSTLQRHPWIRRVNRSTPRASRSVCRSCRHSTDQQGSPDEGKKVATVKKTKAAASKKVLRSNKAPDPKAAAKAKAKRTREAMVTSGGNDLDAITATILSRWEE